MKIRVADAKGIVLDYLAYKARNPDKGLSVGMFQELHSDGLNHYSESPNLIQRVMQDNQIGVQSAGSYGWVAIYFPHKQLELVVSTIGEAVMRRFVILKLGGEVEVPDELM